MVFFTYTAVCLQKSNINTNHILQVIGVKNTRSHKYFLCFSLFCYPLAVLKTHNLCVALIFGLLLTKIDVVSARQPL